MPNLIKQLSSSYLSKFINNDEFETIIKSFQKIAENGLMVDNLKDNEIISIYFQSAIPDDFFCYKKKLTDLLLSIPEITQEKVKRDLHLSRIQDLQWNNEVSSYFVNEFELDSKFLYNDIIEDIHSENLGISMFDKSSIKFKKLKYYQAEVSYQIFEYLNNTAYSRAILQMPTGSGKTRTAIEIVCDFINENKGDVIWLANTEELCNQAFEAFNEIWGFIGNKELISVNHQQYNSNFNVDEQAFHVCSIQSLNNSNNYSKYGIDINKIDLVVIDEAHISIAPTYKNTISNLISNGAKLLGLTATPGRQLKYVNIGLEEEVSDENKELSNFFYNKLFQINTKSQKPIDYLRAQGILSNARFISLEGKNIENVLKKNQIEAAEVTKTIPKIIEKMLSSDAERNSMIFEQLVELLEKQKKIIFFGTSVSHSKMMSTLLNIKGFKSAHIDGNSGTYRKNIINSFRNNELQILCNYGVLSTGFDDPAIDVVFMTRPTNSIVLYSQIIGRGLRGPAVGGTKSCDIYTVIDNISDLPANNEIYDYFSEYFIN